MRRRGAAESREEQQRHGVEKLGNGKAEKSNAKKSKGKAKMRLDAQGKGGEYAKNPAKGR